MTLFGIPVWIYIVGLFLPGLGLLVAAATMGSGQMRRHGHQPAHRRPPDNPDYWLDGLRVDDTVSFSHADERAFHRWAAVPQRPLSPFPGDELAVVIEGPWPVQEPAGLIEEDPPAPELLDDLDGSEDNLEAARAELATARAKLAQARQILDRTDAELDDDPAPELAPGHVQRPEKPGEESYCNVCEERCTGAQPCVCCWLGDLSEDQAAELDEDQAAALALLKDQHRRQIAEQDRDAADFMSRLFAELDKIRAGLAGR